MSRICTLRTLTPVLFCAALLAGAFMVASPTSHLQAQTASMGGAFVPTADTTVTGKWTMAGGYALSGTGTIATGATLTTPTIAGYTMTGTGTIANGATITTPVLSGTVSGTYTLGGTPTLTSPTISGTPVITGAALSSGNFLGAPAVLSSASLGGSPVTLTAAQCGQAFALDAATGVVYLLPATLPTAGCTYDFYVTVSVTSNANEIETNNAAHFFQGAPFMIAAGATLATGQCNGSSHIAYKTNGTTTGGLIGTHLKAIVLSATNVLLDGVNAGSGSLSTACSASN